jgi:acyl-CoA synthetase (AMP-forming)/AMP-acid ligase II
MIWTSPYEPVEVGGATLPALVAAQGRSSPERPALIDGGSGLVVSYAGLASRIEGVAAGLAAVSFGPGDVLALWAPNLPQWAGVALGAMTAGGQVTGVSPLATDRELAGQLSDAGASVLVTVPALAERALAAAPACVREVVVLGAPSGGATPIADLLERGRPGTLPAVDEDAVALLPYSSGTTGLPKAVMLTHRNLVTAIRQLGRHLRVGQRDVVLAVAPFPHVMGFIVTCALPLAAGATVVTMARFDLERLLELVERQRVTVLVVPPPVVAALAHNPLAERFDLSSLELIVSGGAPLAAELQRAVAARLPGAAVGQGYGLTETTVGVAGADRDAGTLPGSVGRVMPNTELRVIDSESGRELGPDEDGELWVRGPQNTPGCLGRPDATAALIDPDGWLHTGDLGDVDRDGNVWIVDRLKELIKVGGLQVAPAELEALLATHPQVGDAAVVPATDPHRGEIPVAVVVPRGELDPDQLIAWTAERVAPHKRIRQVRLVDQIPRTPAGKILRRRLNDHHRPPERHDPLGRETVR